MRPRCPSRAPWNRRARKRCETTGRPRGDFYGHMEGGSHGKDQRNGKMQGMSELLSNIDGQTLVYCQSPASCGRLVRELIQRDTFSLAADPELIDAANWAAKYFHEEWHVVEALRHGVGIHHGRVPRGLSRFMIKSFEKGLIRFPLHKNPQIPYVLNRRFLLYARAKVQKKFSLE